MRRMDGSAIIKAVSVVACLVCVGPPDAEWLARHLTRAGFPLERQPEVLAALESTQSTTSLMQAIRTAGGEECLREPSEYLLALLPIQMSLADLRDTDRMRWLDAGDAPLGRDLCAALTPALAAWGSALAAECRATSGAPVEPAAVPEEVDAEAMAWAEDEGDAAFLEFTRARAAPFHRGVVPADPTRAEAESASLAAECAAVEVMLAHRGPMESLTILEAWAAPRGIPSAARPRRLIEAMGADPEMTEAAAPEVHAVLAQWHAAWWPMARRHARERLSPPDLVFESIASDAPLPPAASGATLRSMQAATAHAAVALSALLGSPLGRGVALPAADQARVAPALGAAPSARVTNDSPASGLSRCAPGLSLAWPSPLAWEDTESLYEALGLDEGLLVAARSRHEELLELLEPLRAAWQCAAAECRWGDAVALEERALGMIRECTVAFLDAALPSPLRPAAQWVGSWPAVGHAAALLRRAGSGRSSPRDGLAGVAGAALAMRLTAGDWLVLGPALERSAERIAGLARHVQAAGLEAERARMARVSIAGTEAAAEERRVAGVAEVAAMLEVARQHSALSDCLVTEAAAIQAAIGDQPWIQAAGTSP